MQVKINFRSILVIFLLAGGLTGCSDTDGTSQNKTIETSKQNNASPSVPASGDRLVSASIGDASNLIPIIAGDASSHAIAGQMYLSLLKYDKDLNLTGQLARSWEVSENNLTIIFHLRPGLHWTDGTSFTSADCAFTLHLIQDKHTQSAYKSDYVKVIRVETPDSLTFIAHYSEPFSPALSSWASLNILPKHIFEHEDIMNTTLSRHQFLELSAGRLDSMGLSPVQYTRLFNTKPQLKTNYNRYKYLDFVYTYLGFNLKRPLFADHRVREAMAYAINRQEIVDGVLLGLGKVIASPYKPGTKWVNKQLHPRPYDPDKAKKILLSAGWSDHNGDGILDNNGRPLSFTILTNNGNKQRADTATIIQQRLKAIGIEVKVRLVEWSAFIENFINKRNFDAVILGWSLSPEPDQYSIWHSSQTGQRQFNFLSYSNAKVDHALVEARRTFNEDKRKQLYDTMQKEIYRDVPMVFLYAPYSLPVYHKRIHGIKPAPAGIGYNSEHWFVPESEQKYQVSIQP